MTTDIITLAKQGAAGKLGSPAAPNPPPQSSLHKPGLSAGLFFAP